jgi:hypothetical protein
MLLGREVRFSAIFLSCIAVLCDRTGAFGTEEAVGAPACVSRCVCPISCSLSPAIAESHGGIPSSSGGLIRRPHLNIPEQTVSAMALPDGPGAVCVGVVGFVCVSLVRNRRIWIGLCLFAISHGRIGAARLSRMGVPGPDCAGCDSLSESGSNHLWRCESSRRGPRSPGIRPVTSLRVPDLLGFVAVVRPASLGRLRDESDSTCVPPQSDVVFDGSRMTRPILARRAVASLSVRGKCVQLARPPPVSPPNFSG